VVILVFLYFMINEFAKLLFVDGSVLWIDSDVLIYSCNSILLIIKIYLIKLCMFNNVFSKSIDSLKSV